MLRLGAFTEIGGPPPPPPPGGPPPPTGPHSPPPPPPPRHPPPARVPVAGRLGPAAVGAPAAPASAATTLTMRGADISSLQRSLDLGATYYNAAGTAADPPDLL